MPSMLACGAGTERQVHVAAVDVVFAERRRDGSYDELTAWLNLARLPNSEPELTERAALAARQLCRDARRLSLATDRFRTLL